MRFVKAFGIAAAVVIGMASFIAAYIGLLMELVNLGVSWPFAVMGLPLLILFILVFWTVWRER